MSYVQQYFGKDGDALAFADIQHFFATEKEESDKIEFKSFVASENFGEKYNGIIRTICGFLNSEGGLVIWGAPVGQNVVGRDEKVFKGELTPMPNLIEKDSFIGKVTDSITPAPDKINFYKVFNQASTGYVYIIDVKKSEYSPHQFRNVYYMRLDGQTKPAPHHYIEALFKKVSFSKIRGYIKLEDAIYRNRQLILDIQVVLFNFSRYINEKDTFTRLMIGNHATFQENGLPSTNITLLQAGHHAYKKNSEPLYYNQPFRDYYPVIIDLVNVMRSGKKIEVYLVFGGETCPLMRCNYCIDLTGIDVGVLPIQMKPFLKIDFENKFSFDISDSLRTSDEESINSLLDR